MGPYLAALGVSYSVLRLSGCSLGLISGSGRLDLGPELLILGDLEVCRSEGFPIKSPLNICPGVSYLGLGGSIWVQNCSFWVIWAFWGPRSILGAFLGGEMSELLILGV